MPQKDEVATVSFQLPVYKGSQQNIQYKTVHIVLVKPDVNTDAFDFQVILGPLTFVFIIAITILFILSKLKPGGKTDKILDGLERVSNNIDNKVQSGKL